MNMTHQESEQPMSKFIKLTLRESGRTIAIDATRVSKIRAFKEGGCVVVGHEVNCEVSQSIDEILAQIGGEKSQYNDGPTARLRAAATSLCLSLPRYFRQTEHNKAGTIEDENVRAIHAAWNELDSALKASNP